MPIDTSTPQATRRRFLGSVTGSLLSVIGGILGVLGGGAAFSSTVRREEGWLAAATLHDLPDHEPTPVTLSVMRRDGYREALERRVIFLVKTGEAEVSAFDAECTHLGCLVAWDPGDRVFRCPCHGGVFDRDGAVLEGPPPDGLVPITAMVDGDRVLVQA